MKSKRSKRYKNLSLLYSIEKKPYKDSILILKNFANAKFLESLEAHVSLNLDTKYPNQQLRANLLLPYSVFKQKKIAVITEDKDTIYMLSKLGIDLVGSQKVLELLSKGFIDFDILISEPKYVSLLTRYGKLLGPRGLMPSLKSGTVSSNVLETAKDFLDGKKEYRTDKQGVVHICFGNALMEDEHLKQNLLCVYNFILKNKPSGSKGQYIKSFFVCSAMSPSVDIDVNSFYFKN